jgi:hypothetical protein
MVVMSLEAFEAMALQNRIDLALLKAEIESRENDVYNDFDEVAKEKREKLIETLQNRNTSVRIG